MKQNNEMKDTNRTIAYVNVMKQIDYFKNHPHHLGYNETLNYAWAYFDAKAQESILVHVETQNPLGNDFLVDVTNLFLNELGRKNIVWIVTEARLLKEALADVLHTQHVSPSYGMSLSKHAKESIVYFGQAGVVSPLILVKGMPINVEHAFSGISAVTLMMELIKAIETNTEMSDVVCKKMMPPPAFYDVKTACLNQSANLPDVAYGAFHWFCQKDNLSYKMDQLKQLCVWSVEDAINQYNYSYNEYLRKQGLPNYQECQAIDVPVMFFEETLPSLHNLEPLDKVLKNLGDSPAVLIGHTRLHKPIIDARHFFQRDHVPFALPVYPFKAPHMSNGVDMLDIPLAFIDIHSLDDAVKKTLTVLLEL